MNNVELYPPYVMLHNKLKALFGDDPELEFSSLDDDTKSVVIRSENKHKLEALKKALNLEKFETVGFNVFFVYTGAESEQADFVTDLFKGNPHFSRAYVTRDAMAPDKSFTICYFKDETIQYSADSRFVPGGYETTLAESLVKELFVDEARHMKYITEAKK